MVHNIIFKSPKFSKKLNNYFYFLDFLTFNSAVPRIKAVSAFLSILTFLHKMNCYYMINLYVQWHLVKYLVLLENAFKKSYLQMHVCCPKRERPYLQQKGRIYKYTHAVPSEKAVSAL